MSWKYSKERIKRNRARFFKYKKTLQCRYCGLDDHRVLEFHHVEEKDKEVGRMVNTGYSWKTITKEIKKCIPLCSNCHRIEHWENKKANQKASNSETI